MRTLITCLAGSVIATSAYAKDTSTFFPSRLVEAAGRNVEQYPWAAEMRAGIVANAQPWLDLSDDDLWALMFGATITRSWMVWSNGHCPSCEQGVPMYNWRMDALRRPWKVWCPHCSEAFPKNDFGAFYRSGLDEHGVFDPGRADRSLLFNAEHPDPDDPLHQFGVDDGEGFVQGEKRWRFIGAYLIYGQWKQAVLGGIRHLAAAHVVTGDRRYAHKACILLDRVADVYPTFDFKTQALVYESAGAAGYVSTWHDACEETREMVLAYDQVVEGLADDAELVAFLSAKSRQNGLENPKASLDDIRRNIEDRILRDAITSSHKIMSNYPRTPVALITTHAVLGWPANRAELQPMIDAMLDQATAVDGVTGEKGLAGYSAFTIQALGLFLEQFARIDPTFLATQLGRHPRLAETYRFHIDTRCLGKYYPLSGDTGSFAHPMPEYAGLQLRRDSGIEPSMFSFLHRLFRQTGDAAYVQVLYEANDSSSEGLPHDLFCEDAAAVQEDVAAAIAQHGLVPTLGSVNKQQWHIALLRSGHGAHARAAWIDYDSGGGHSHADGLNLGLFAHGLDLMPDFGYPPVQFGGWGSPRATWYTSTAAHNTVLVDGQRHADAAGQTTLWIDAPDLHAIRASAPGLTGGPQFERTVAQVDVDDRSFYVLDVFRVIGGADHAKFMHSHFGTVQTTGLSLQPAEDFGGGTQMRDFRRDPSPRPGWTVDWTIEDRYGLLDPGRQVRLRYIDLTTGAEAWLCEGWVTQGLYDASVEAWTPRVLTRRRAETGPLQSTFVAVIEPYEGAPSIASVRRLPLTDASGAEYPDACVAVEVTLTDGRRDLFITMDVEDPLGQQPSGGLVRQADWGVTFEGDTCWLRRGANNQVARIETYACEVRE